ncbi:hypothetical protein RRF57_003660 [Xylaria bambusicola]|uniref:Uncharacterized protein n=1 Tax=Xylaria bambusicola TaxID=326684 RepID=A0AAN7U8M6_9PEZI
MSAGPSQPQQPAAVLAVTRPLQLPLPPFPSGEGNRGVVDQGTGCELSPRQPIADVKYTLAAALPILHSTTTTSIPLQQETPETPSSTSSSRNSACYGLTSGHTTVSLSTPASSPVSTPSSLLSESPSSSRPRPSTTSCRGTPYPPAPATTNNDSNSRHNHTPSPPRSRRTRTAVSHRSQPELHAARLQRSATLSTSTPPVRRDSIREPKAGNLKRCSLVSTVSTDSASEHPGLNLTKMDDKWIIVQQKTFTKWLVVDTLCTSPEIPLLSMLS